MDKTSFETPDNYEKTLIECMAKHDCSLSEALFYDLVGNDIDTDSVFDIVDHLESKLENLDKVQYYMEVLTGQQPDVALRRL